MFAQTLTCNRKEIHYVILVRVAVGIPAYNEHKNIRALLERIVPLVPEIVHEILVVSSSTNGTDKIVQEYPQATLMHTPREGKASAWNLLIKEAERQNCQALIYLGGDNLPGQNAIPNLLRRLGSNSTRIGIVGARPIPISRENNFLGWYGELQWNIHHLVSERYEPKISGELCAMRVGVVREIPPAIINDDDYIQGVFALRGWQAVYDPTALVFLQTPKTLDDLIKQRYRIYIGHHQTRFLLGRKPMTIQYRSLKLLSEAMPDHTPRSYLYLILSIMIQAYAYLRARVGVIIGDLPYKWKMAESTKQLQYGM